MKLRRTKRSRFLDGFILALFILLMPSVLAAQEKVAFESKRDGNEEIYIMNADGSNQTRMTFNPAFDGRPAFSPGGSKIAFTSSRDGNLEIYIMHADGSFQTNLTKNAAWDDDPTFSADGKQIAFISNRAGQTDVWVMNVDGSNPTQVTDGVLHARAPLSVRMEGKSYFRQLMLILQDRTTFSS